LAFALLSHVVSPALTTAKVLNALSGSATR
jgi:hypothetical protein